MPTNWAGLQYPAVTPGVDPSLYRNWLWQQAQQRAGSIGPPQAPPQPEIWPTESGAVVNEPPPEVSTQVDLRQLRENQRQAYQQQVQAQALNSIQQGEGFGMTGLPALAYLGAQSALNRGDPEAAARSMIAGQAIDAIGAGINPGVGPFGPIERMSRRAARFVRGAIPRTRVSSAADMGAPMEESISGVGPPRDDVTVYYGGRPGDGSERLAVSPRETSTGQAGHVSFMLEGVYDGVPVYHIPLMSGEGVDIGSPSVSPAGAALFRALYNELWARHGGEPVELDFSAAHETTRNLEKKLEQRYGNGPNGGVMLRFESRPGVPRGPMPERLRSRVPSVVGAEPKPGDDPDFIRRFRQMRERSMSQEERVRRATEVITAPENRPNLSEGYIRTGIPEVPWDFVHASETGNNPSDPAQEASYQIDQYYSLPTGIRGRRTTPTQEPEPSASMAWEQAHGGEGQLEGIDPRETFAPSPARVEAYSRGQEIEERLQSFGGLIPAQNALPDLLGPNSEFQRQVNRRRLHAWEQTEMSGGLGYDAPTFATPHQRALVGRYAPGAEAANQAEMNRRRAGGLAEDVLPTGLGSPPPSYELERAVREEGRQTQSDFQGYNPVERDALHYREHPVKLAVPVSEADYATALDFITNPEVIGRVGTLVPMEGGVSGNAILVTPRIVYSATESGQVRPGVQFIMDASLMADWDTQRRAVLGGIVATMQDHGVKVEGNKVHYSAFNRSAGGRVGVVVPEGALRPQETKAFVKRAAESGLSVQTTAGGGAVIHLGFTAPVQHLRMAMDAMREAQGERFSVEGWQAIRGEFGSFSFTNEDVARARGEIARFAGGGGSEITSSYAYDTGLRPPVSAAEFHAVQPSERLVGDVEGHGFKRQGDLIPIKGPTEGATPWMAQRRRARGSDGDVFMEVRGLQGDPVQLADDYSALPKVQEMGGRYYSQDEATKVYPSYSKANHGALIRNGAGLAADFAYERDLPQPVRPGKQPVVSILLGTPGAGKTHELSLPDTKESDMVIDTPGRNAANVQRYIEMALASGRDVRLNYIYTKAGSAVRQSGYRSAEEERAPDPGYISGRHEDVLMTAVRMMRAYRHSHRVNIKVVDKSDLRLGPEGTSSRQRGGRVRRYRGKEAIDFLMSRPELGVPLAGEEAAIKVAHYLTRVPGLSQQQQRAQERFLGKKDPTGLLRRSAGPPP